MKCIEGVFKGGTFTGYAPLSVEDEEVSLNRLVGRRIEQIEEFALPQGPGLEATEDCFLMMGWYFHNTLKYYKVDDNTIRIVLERTQVVLINLMLWTTQMLIMDFSRENGYYV